MELEVEKETHDLRIISFNLARTQLKCDLRTEIEVEIMNLGKKDEDEVVYTIKNSALGIDITEGGPGNYIELESDPYDEDNTFSKTHTITLPSDTAPGTYTIEMRLYRDKDELEDYQSAELTILACEEEEEQPPEEEISGEEVEVITPPMTPTISGPVVAEPEEGLLFGLNEWVIVGLLGAIFILALIIVIILAMK
ncbi:hypothetical protein DRJ48_01100 [Candidatus Woesearchaeota archaeon]|mgnify:CR=1 FL=1|nr:MAG: hypothetical protein DRJ48_01100 [Candidatus Woesearchaeota archaeon]